MRRISFFFFSVVFVLGCGEGLFSENVGENPLNSQATAEGLVSQSLDLDDEDLGPELIEVKPSGDSAIDLQNVQWAVDNVREGGTVRLMGLDESKIPTAFNFGAPFTQEQDFEGNIYNVVNSVDPTLTVFLSQDVTIVGEGINSDLTNMTTITRGSQVFRPSNAAIADPITVTVRNIDFYLCDTGFYSGNEGGFKDLTVENCRFENVFDGVHVRSYDRLEVNESVFENFWRFAIFLNPRAHHGIATIVTNNVMTSGPQVVPMSYRIGVWLDSYLWGDASNSGGLGDTVITDNIIHMTTFDIMAWALAVEPEGRPPVEDADLRIQRNIITLEGEGDFEFPRMFGIDLFGAANNFLVEDNQIYGEMRMGIRMISPYPYTSVPAGSPSAPANNVIQNNIIEGRFAHENQVYGSGIWLGGSNNRFINNTINCVEGSQNGVLIFAPGYDSYWNPKAQDVVGNEFSENIMTGSAEYGFNFGNLPLNSAAYDFELIDNDFSGLTARMAQVLVGPEAHDNTFTANTYGSLQSPPAANSARILVDGHSNRFEYDYQANSPHPWEEGHGFWRMTPFSSDNTVCGPEIEEPKPGRTIFDYWKDQSELNQFLLECL